MDIREAIVNNQPLRVWEKGQQTRTDASQLGSNIKGLSAGVFPVMVRKVGKASASCWKIYSV